MSTARALLHHFRQGRPTGPRALQIPALNSARLCSSRHIFTTPRLQQPSTQRIAVKGDRGTDSEIPTGIFYDGKWQKGTGEPLDVYNPATGEHLATVDTASVEDVDKAVKAARHAFETTWGTNVPPTERGRLLNRLADLLEQNFEEISAIEAADGGKPLQWAKADVSASLAALRYYAGLADKIHGQSIEVNDTERQVFTRREPIGVAAAIIPWNFPIMMAVWKLGPALAAGCSIIMKTAENTPLSALRLGELIVEAGYPAGAYSLLTGTGKVTGQALASHMDIDKVAFTGSTATGRHIAVTAAQSNLKIVTLELGGKSPNIVFPSANLEEAAKWAAFGLFETGGQSCIVGSRILVHESIHDAFVKLFVARVSELTVGKGEDAFYGTVISQTQFDKVMGYIAKGKEEAKLEIGGEQAFPGGEGKGFFVQPTVFSNVSPTSTIGTEEIFGPVATILKFSSEDEAVEIANATSYGLAAAIHTTDLNQAPRVVRRLKAGTTWINTYSPLTPQAPFGGYKASGWGRELGTNGIEAYLTTKTVHQYFGSPLDWPVKL